MKVYKVCYRSGIDKDSSLYSAWLGYNSKYCSAVKYIIGKKVSDTIPKTPLMAFTTLEAAKAFRQKIAGSSYTVICQSTRLPIFLAEAEKYEFRTPKQINNTHPESLYPEMIRDFWKAFRRKSKEFSKFDKDKAPDNTVFCSSIKLIKQVD